jgi:hypothetical protein
MLISSNVRKFLIARDRNFGVTAIVLSIQSLAACPFHYSVLGLTSYLFYTVENYTLNSPYSPLAERQALMRIPWMKDDWIVPHPEPCAIAGRRKTPGNCEADRLSAPRPL